MNRFHSLTSLRFFAAASVALMHAFGQNEQIPVLNLGYLGVSFFFALSGFVLTWADAAGSGAAQFFRNRFAKLFPLNAATLVVATVVPFAVPGGMIARRITFIASLTMTQAWLPGTASSFNPVTWSLSAEAFFYLLFPLLIRVLRSFRVGDLLGTVVFLAVLQPALGTVVQSTLDPATAHFLTYDFPPYRLPEFVIGIAAAMLMQRGYQPTLRVRSVSATLAVSAVAAALAIDLFGARAVWWLGDALALPFIVCLIWSVAERERRGDSTILIHPRLVALGDRSFALYMVHYLVLGAAAVAVGVTPQTLPWWLALPCLVAAFGLAGLTYRYLEKPCERALRDLLSRRRSATAAATHG
ncbi:acyltransferase family protein [Curtobacterium ammoniigenes]|uniref:acyltransferase family protein n=1 Tax=Curtobacterium ammoniigenes TaxID=395387 RepID=UPI0008336B80|nr:acyltransferase [Curtobacterium ammoniigenes]